MDNSKISILIIEDDDALRNSMAFYLEDENFNVITAENGKIGVEKIKSDKPDFILTDLRMPELDGLEVLRIANETYPEIPIIVVSGTGNIGDTVQALRLGAWDYILKPIHDMSIILIAIEKALERAQLIRENREYQEDLELLIKQRTNQLEQANTHLTNINSRLRKVVDTTRSLSLCANITKFGSTLLDEFVFHMDASGGSVFLLEDKGLKKLHTTEPAHVPKYIPFPLPKGSILFNVIKNKKPLIIQNIANENKIKSSGWNGYKNGSLIAFPLPDESGEIIGIITLHSKSEPPFIEQDKEIGTILASYSCETLRALKASETLRESETRFRDLAEMLPEAIFESDYQFKLTYANQQAFKLFGYSEKDLKKGLSGFDLIVPKERARAKRGIKLSKKNIELGIVEFQLLKKNGNTFPTLLHVNPIIQEEKTTGFRGIIIDISERKKIEEELKSSEERLKILFESAPDAYYINDLKGNFIDGNKAAEELLNYKKEELIGKNFLNLNLLRAGDLGKASKALAKNLLGQSTGPDNFVLQRKDGIQVPVEIRTHPVKIKNKTVVLGIARNISDRIKSELALKESEEKYRTIINESPIGIFYFDKIGTITECNQKFVEIIGSSYNALIGFNMLDHLKDRNMVEAIAQTLKTGSAYYEDLYVSVTAKKSTYVRILLNAIRDKNDSIIAGLGLVEDITDRKLAENELLKFKLGIELSNDAIFMTNIDGGIIFVNPAFEKMYGYSTEEAKGQTPRIISSGNIAKKNYEGFWNKLINKETVSGEFINKTKENKKINVEFSINPILDDRKEIIGFLAIHRDVTERKQAEQERLKLKKLESVGVLAGGIAHDFNNLLTGLFGNIELAKLFLEDGHRSIKFLESAEQSMGNAINLTKQLLTFAKGGDPIKETVSIGEAIIEMAEFSIRGSNVKLHTKIAPDLLPVDADKGQLSQVISNLVINAQQAMPSGGAINITAENDKTMESKFVKITVADEGIGIAPQFLDKIFDPYFSTKQKGSGLGLASCHSIINKHDGRITVESKLNQGTMFSIYLPASVKIQKMSINNKGEKKKIVDKPITSGHVLVLDDEEMVRDVIGAMLKKMGLKVSFAINGKEAVEKYRKAFQKNKVYDIVITDLTIPGGMGGVETAKEVLHINPQAKMIVSSGYATDPVMANYEEYGFKGVSAKPYRFKDLQEVILKVIKM